MLYASNEREKIEIIIIILFLATVFGKYMNKCE